MNRHAFLAVVAAHEGSSSSSIADAPTTGGALGPNEATGIIAGAGGADVAANQECPECSVGSAVATLPAATVAGARNVGALLRLGTRLAVALDACEAGAVEHGEVTVDGGSESAPLSISVPIALMRSA